MLEQWSTICIRHFRGRPVGEASADYVDFLTLQAQIELGDGLFGELHERARWVATLDEFVGRDQIEALNRRPDVITVRTGIGSGDAYTLVVSSKDGKDFVIDRLARRLREYVPQMSSDWPTVANELYERARVLSPGLLLRAAGLGRSSQELVGLVSARWLAGRVAPVDRTGSGFEAWIPLDEHVDWFRSDGGLRADLLRISGREENGRLVIEALVVEAKLRSSWTTTHADRQVDNTVKLFAHALASEPDAPDDGSFWRRVVLDAMEQASKQYRTSKGDLRAELAAFSAWSNGAPSRAIPPILRGAWLDGAYVLRDVRGLVCTIWPDDVEVSVSAA